MIDRQPEIRRAASKARRSLVAIQRQARAQDVLAFEEARNALDWARVEVAYNLGFEDGLVRARIECMSRKGSRRRLRARLIVRTLSAAIASRRGRSTDVTLAILELAHALLSGAPSPD
jgi:hypothetical protein